MVDFSLLTENQRGKLNGKKILSVLVPSTDNQDVTSFGGYLDMVAIS